MALRSVAPLAWDSLRSGELVAVPIRDRLVNNATIDAITHSARQLPLAAESSFVFCKVSSRTCTNLRTRH